MPRILPSHRADVQCCNWPVVSFPSCSWYFCLLGSWSFSCKVIAFIHSCMCSFIQQIFINYYLNHLCEALGTEHSQQKADNGFELIFSLNGIKTIHMCVDLFRWKQCINIEQITHEWSQDRLCCVLEMKLTKVLWWVLLVGQGWEWAMGHCRPRMGRKALILGTKHLS